MPIAWDNESVGTQRTTLQDFTPSLGYTTARAAQQAWADNPVTRLYQWGGNLLDNSSEKLDAGAIDGLVKSAGVTDFALPAGQYSKEAAMSLIERHRQAQISADIDSRTPYSLAETPVRALTRAATMMADPLNLAAMFVPGLGEEWAATRLAAGAGKFSTGFLRGASQGAAGMGALEGVNYPLAQALHDDYTSTDSLMNVFAGAGIGGVLHGLGTALRERPALPPSVDDAAKRTAIAQSLQDHPVTVDHLGGTWAADSKVRGADGELLRVYHGTGTEIHAFDQDGLGTHFTADPKVASEFAADHPGDNNVVPAYLDIQNPLRIEDHGGSHTDARNVAQALIDAGALPKDYINDAFLKRLVEGDYAANNVRELAEMRRILQEKGYDGIVYNNRAEGGGDSYIPFRPEQVRSSLDAGRPFDLEQARASITANRERNILDGDGTPPRTEAQPKAEAGAEVDAKLADAQAKAQDATQRAESSVKALREQMAPKGEPAAEPKPAPEIVAADKAIQQAAAEAKAFESIANCQRLA